MPGMSIHSYDLEPAQRDGYLSWLHERYLPALLKRPGIEWAAHYLAEKRSPPARLTNTGDRSVPGGGDYILLVGAATAHVFSPPRPGETLAPVADNEAGMLALRVNESVSIMVEESQVSGPEAAKHASGPCIQLGRFNASPEDENELLAWYARWRLPCMEKLPGCVRTRKLAGVVGWAKHAVLYEFTSLDMRDKYFPTHEKPYPELEAWTDKLVRRLLHAPRSPQIAQRIWPP